MRSMNTGFSNRAVHNMEVVTTLLDTHKTLIDSYCLGQDNQADDVLKLCLHEYQSNYKSALAALKRLRNSHQKVLNRLEPPAAV